MQGCAAAIVLAVPPFELVALPKPENQEGENELKKPSLFGVLAKIVNMQLDQISTYIATKVGSFIEKKKICSSD